MRQRLGIADALVKSPGPADPRRADDLDRPARRRRDPRPAAPARRRARPRDHALEPPADARSSRSATGSGSSRPAGSSGDGTVARARQPSSATATAAIEVGLELPTPADAKRAERDAARRCRIVESRRRRPTGQRRRGSSTSAPPTEEASVRQAILVAAVEHGLRLTALRPVVPSLDDIYRTALERPSVVADRRRSPGGRRTAA